MKRFFHSELEEFRSRVVLMGEKAILQVDSAVEALLERDIDRVEAVLRQDDALDELEVQIDADVLRYISLRAPVATELRLLTAGMKSAHDLERIGDEACTIAKRTRELLDLDRPVPLEQLPRMNRLAMGLLRDALDAFLNEDIELARAIPKRDKEIDAINKAHFEAYKQQMERGELSADGAFALIFISKSIERIADHATNLAEEVVFLYCGDDIRHNSEGKVS
jgi:phosphate transport system protein